MPPPSPTEPRSFDQVVVAGGHMTDQPGRPSPRFPPSQEAAVTEEVRAALEKWGVKAGTLVVTGGARGADIIAGEQALELGADVWLLLPLPEEHFVAQSVHVDGSDGRWDDRFADLRRRCPTWFQHEELEPAAAGDDVFERNNVWCLEVAAAQARQGRRHVLVVWDGERGDGRGGAAHLAERGRSTGASVAIIRPHAAPNGRT